MSSKLEIKTRSENQAIAGQVLLSTEFIPKIITSSNEYPKIKISVEKNTASFGFNVKVSVTEKPGAQEKVMQETLSVKQNAFQPNFLTSTQQAISQCSIQTSSKKSTVKFSKIAGSTTDLVIDILPDGSMLVEEANSTGSVEIKSGQDVVVIGELSTKHLDITAPNIVIEDSIQSDHISLQAGRLFNKAVILSARLELATQKEFYNQGIIESAKIRAQASGAFENLNTIRAPDFRIYGTTTFSNSGLLDCSQFHSAAGFTKHPQFYMEGKTIHNNGNILTIGLGAKLVTCLINEGYIAGEKLNIDCKGEIDNTVRGTLFASNSLHLEGNSFSNNGHLNSPTILLYAARDLKNSKPGKIEAKHLTLETGQGMIDNQSVILAEDCSTFTTDDFNNSGVFLVEQTFSINPQGGFKNSGKMGASKLLIIARRDISQGANSVIQTCFDVTLQTVTGTKIAGKIQGDNITSTSGKSTIIEAQGALIANNTLSLAAKKLLNAGVVHGKDAYLKLLQELINSGRMSAENSLSVSAYTCTNSGQIVSGGNTTMDLGLFLKQLGGAHLESLQAMSLKIQGDLCNAAEATIAAHELDIRARGLIENSGCMEAATITVESMLLDNLLTGVILAAEKLNITAEQVENRGEVDSNGSAEIATQSLLKNLQQGSIGARKALLIKCRGIMGNLGKILGDSKVTLEATEWLYNALGAVISANGAIKIDTASLNNSGKINTKSTLTIKVLNILHNHSTGEMHAKGLHAISQCMLSNDGLLASEKGLCADIKLILENQGKITAKEALQLINASIIQNSGKIAGQKTVTLHAKHLINNLQQGQISAKDLLKLISGFAQQNAGLLKAETIHIEATQLLENTLTGEMRAKKELKMSVEGGFLLNHGACHSRGGLKVNADCIYNFSTGKMTAAQTLELIAKNNIEQKGRIEAAHACIKALTLTNSGSITVKTASINIADTFTHCAEGTISASEAVEVFTKNLYLLGQLIGKGEISFDIDKTFEYNHEMVWACGLLKLMIKGGYDFNKPLNTTGALSLILDEDVNLSAQAKEGQVNITHMPTAQMLHIGTTKNINVQGNNEVSASLSLEGLNITIEKDSSLNVRETLILRALNNIAVNGEVQARNMHVEARQCKVTGKIKAAEHFAAKVEQFELIQSTTQDWVIVTINQRDGIVLVPVTNAVKDSAVINADSIHVQAGTYYQLGGKLHSLRGGTILEVRDKVVIEALRTTKVEQAEVTRKGCNFQVEPHFIPAEISSRGDQFIIVTHGSFTATGMESSADGRNVIDAKQQVEIKNCNEKFTEASKGGRRSESTSTSFTNMSSHFHGGEGIHIRSRDSSITIIGSILTSGGDAVFQAKTLIAILNDTANTSSSSKQTKRKGFGVHKYNESSQEEHVLQSQMAVCGDAYFITEGDVHLKSLGGFIGGDMSVQALNVVMEGAVQQQTNTSSTKSFTVDFFGSQAMEAVYNGKNSREVLHHLLRNDSFLGAIKDLVDTKDKSEKRVQAIQTFIEGWRLAAMVGYACGEMGTDGTQGDVMGKLTDRWGLTSSSRDQNGNLQRKFNPNFTFTYSQSKTTQQSSRTLPTTLNVGGKITIIADIVKLLDGTRIHATNIHIHARKLLEIRAATNTDSMQHSQSSHSITVALDGTIKGIGTSAAESQSQSVHHQNAVLQAKNSVTIVSDKVDGAGVNIQGQRVAIEAGELRLTSLQNVHRSDGSSHSISISESSASASYGEKHAERIWVDNQTGIHAEQSSDLRVDRLSLTGSRLSADQLLRLRGRTQAKPQSIEHTSLHDSNVSKSSGVSVGVTGGNDSFPVQVKIASKRQNQQGRTQATIAAPDMEGAPEDINRDISQAQVVTRNKQSNTNVLVAYVNLSQAVKDGRAITTAMQQKLTPTTPAAPKTEQKQKLDTKPPQATKDKQDRKPTTDPKTQSEHKGERDRKPSEDTKTQSERSDRKPASDTKTQSEHDELFDRIIFDKAMLGLENPLPSKPVPNDDWQPIVLQQKTKRTKISTERTSTGGKRYRNADTGEISRSPLKHKYQNQSQIQSNAKLNVKTEGMPDRLWYWDIIKRQTRGDNGSVGVRPFLQASGKSELGSKTGHLDLQIEGSVGAGVNYATYGNVQEDGYQIDLNLVQARTALKAQAQNKRVQGKSINSIVLSAEAMLRGPEILTQFELPMTTNGIPITCQVKAGVSVLSFGLSAGYGYQDYSTRDGGNTNVQMGVGIGPIGARLMVDCEIPPSARPD